ncbi:MAG: glycosyltransferase family 4 protein [Pseudomonadota bacterium]
MTVKAAIITPTLSHFEVPMFRLASTLSGLDVRVLHTDLRDNAFYDKDYGRVIDWGEALRSGYPNTGYASMPEVATAVFDWSPDVVLQYGYFWRGALPLFARMRMRRIPVVHRGLLTPYKNTRHNPLITNTWRAVQPHLLRRFQGHHYGGSYSEGVLKAAGIPKEQRFFVPYSIDTPYFAARADAAEEIENAEQLKKVLGWAEDAPVVLFMCQQSWFKAPDVMLRVVAEAQKSLPNLKLLMAGSGQMTDELKAYAEAHLLAGSFHFPGYVSSKQTMPYYLAADLVMFPSRYDTWSRGVNEAMLARRPCIVSRIVPAAGGLVEDGENGYVVDGLEPEAFAARVLEFFRRPEGERKKMGQAARARAETFSYEAHADDLRRSFMDVVGAHSMMSEAR